MILKKLKWFQIIKDTLFFYLIFIVSIFLATISFVSIDEIFLDGKYIEQLSKTDELSLIESTLFGNYMLVAIYILILTTIYRSGKSDPDNRLLHMICVAGLLWLFPGIGIATEKPDPLWFIFNIAVFIITVAISHYIYKSREEKIKTQ